MLSRAISFFLLLFALPSFAAPGGICLQTFNVYGPAYARSVESRLGRLADALVQEPCASQQFQELWRESDYQLFERRMQPSRMALLHADRIRGDKALTGLASAFSGQVLSAHSELFRVNNEGGVIDWIRDLSGVQKGFTLMEVKLDHSPVALFANLHTHPTKESIRVAQLTQMIHSLFERPETADRPLLLTGDLNATPDSLELAMLRNVLLLRDSYVEANGPYLGICTYCGSNPLSWSRSDRVIDFVMIRNAPQLALETKSSAVNLKGEPRSPLSDHYGVRSELSWKERPEALLGKNSALVKERLERAALTMEKAENLLAAEGRAFRPMAEQARALRESFQRRELKPAQWKVFLTP